MQAVVCSDGRFRAMREALHRCDPPCIPYLGMYLTDLSFIEEGTPDFTQDRLLNFSKMRMVSENGNFYKINVLCKCAMLYIMEKSNNLLLFAIVL